MTRSKKSSANKKRAPGGARKVAGQHRPRPKSRASQRLRQMDQQLRALQPGNAPGTRIFAKPGLDLAVSHSGGLETLRRYARILVHPFTAPLTGIPTYPAVPSVHARCVEAGVFKTGSDGIGFVLATPTISNGSTVAYVSSSTTFAHEGYANATAVLSIGAPFANTDFGTDKLKSRVVACALRVRNTTEYGNRGGQAYLFQQPDGDPLDTLPATSSNCRRYAQQGCWKAVPSDGSWATIHWRKTEPNQYDYAPQGYASLALKCLSCYAVANSQVQTYEWELVTIGEYIGGISEANGMLPGARVPSIHPNATLVDAHATHAMECLTGAQAHEPPGAVAEIIAHGAAFAKDIESTVNAVKSAVPAVQSAFTAAAGFIGL